MAHIPASASTHVLVLNKFPIIARHFILATREYKEQDEDLEEDDVAMTLACLRSWRDGADDDSKQGKCMPARGCGRRLFAFFNSGSRSGASQPHRHVQFLPADGMCQGEEGGDSDRHWAMLIDEVERCDREGKERLKLPFAYYAKTLEEHMTGADVHGVYRELLQQWKDRWSSAMGLEARPEYGFSYNLGITTSYMMLMPRLRDGVDLVNEEGEEVGFVSLNGTALAGTLMVKKWEEWKCLRAKGPQGIDKVFGGVGLVQSE